MQKEQEVQGKLQKVHDPELDQPLPELGFIDRTIIDENDVEIVFRLPTYWCSPNFAYIMAEDIRLYVSELDWVESIKVRLIDHSASEEINEGVTRGRKFSNSFNGQSDGELEGLRRKFQIKAFYARQDRLVRHLLNNDLLDEKQVIALTVDQLKCLNLSWEGASLREKYLVKKQELMHPEANVYAITDHEGKKISIEELPGYMFGIKSTRLSMEFNGHYCRGLLEARYHLSGKN
ncbi:Metal-sulfur cluster biosynthetic enzyme [Alteribacillus persepolensis]|uniref:Metal-sulfur cluster biosynthetic enzyme n=1 Tax=Alteribacillus persepolensis TaxID=568899 RepID=A0A1G8HTU3_9BACI|nr:iron-sulfur cluster assembly protein [Alteribacillus persepolensis]SDI10095.1 Metal-sulfur cluster biosynthetic enzyme [Alteribacillus persepolensis]